jgi:hypothetical protein
MQGNGLKYDNDHRTSLKSSRIKLQVTLGWRIRQSGGKFTDFYGKLRRLHK